MVDAPLLESLDPRAVRELMERAIPRTLRPKEILFWAGDRTPRLHLVLDGLIKLVSRSTQGSESILCLAPRGTFVGEMTLFDGLPQPYEAVAVTECEVLGIDGHAVMNALTNNGRAGLAMCVALTERMRWVCESAAERGSSSAPARLAGRLLDLADMMGHVDHAGVVIDLPMAQEDLGHLAGTSRETVCKTLRRFQRAGVVDYSGRRLRITRPDMLERIRCRGKA